MNRPPSRDEPLNMISFAAIGLGNTVIDLAIFTFNYQVLNVPLARLRREIAKTQYRRGNDTCLRSAGLFDR
jgi:hypothetical protein